MTKEYVIFATNYLKTLYGGDFSLQGEILVFNNGPDEFYCDLQYKTDNNKWKFWHRYKGQQEYYVQCTRTGFITGLYTCFIQINKYAGIPYNNQERIRVQRLLTQAWNQYYNKEMVGRR